MFIEENSIDIQHPYYLFLKEQFILYCKEQVLYIKKYFQKDNSFWKKFLEDNNIDFILDVSKKNKVIYTDVLKKQYLFIKKYLYSFLQKKDKNKEFNNNDIFLLIEKFESFYYKDRFSLMKNSNIIICDEIIQNKYDKEKINFVLLHILTHIILAPHFFIFLLALLKGIFEIDKKDKEKILICIYMLKKMKIIFPFFYDLWTNTNIYYFNKKILSKYQKHIISPIFFEKFLKYQVSWEIFEKQDAFDIFMDMVYNIEDKVISKLKPELYNNLNDTPFIVFMFDLYKKVCYFFAD